MWIKRDEYEYLVNDNEKLGVELRKVNREIKKQDEFITQLSKKINKIGAFIYRICKDKDGNYVYVCVHDNRKPEIDGSGNDIYLKGALDIFAISTDMNFFGIDLQIKCFPYLQSCFFYKKVSISELHTNLGDNNYEGKGYGKILIEVLKEICREQKIDIISGNLSFVDAENPKKRDKRNGFYEHMGFENNYNDSEKKSGETLLKLKY